jgi:hypothetical protein
MQNDAALRGRGARRPMSTRIATAGDARIPSPSFTVDLMGSLTHVFNHLRVVLIAEP